MVPTVKRAYLVIDASYSPREYVVFVAGTFVDTEVIPDMLQSEEKPKCHGVFKKRCQVLFVTDILVYRAVTTRTCRRTSIPEVGQLYIPISYTIEIPLFGTIQITIITS